MVRRIGKKNSKRVVELKHLLVINCVCSGFRRR